MSTAKLIADHLAAALSTTVRAGKMPPEPHVVGAVIDLPGDEPQAFICSPASWLERVRFAVDFRDFEYNYEAAVSRCRAAVAELNGRDGQTIGGVLFHLILLTSPPFPIGTDDQNRVRIRAQFRAERAFA